MRVRSTLPATLLLALAITTFAGRTAVASFVDIGSSLAGIRDGAVAWGDYDGDGDLDLAISGDESPGLRTRIYRDDAGTFVDIGAVLIGVTSGALAWGDADADGDLDLIVTGHDGSARRTVLYRNDGGVFIDAGAGLPGVNQSAVDWGDYDGDGDLDLVLAGYNGSTRITRVYRNAAGTFVHDTGVAVAGINVGAVEWGDDDRDGDLDLLVVGNLNSGQTATVYRNVAGTFTATVSLQPMWFCDAAWGDYDGDGDLDILMAGTATPSPGRTALVYTNNGAGGYSAPSTLPGAAVDSASVCWGDMDGDGALEALVAGHLGAGAGFAAVYHHAGGGAFDSLPGVGLPQVSAAACAWGDYDADGDLDLAITGHANGILVSRILRNDLGVSNAPPGPPTPLSPTTNGDRITFRWGAASDDHTPAAGLTYNLRVGSTPGGDEIASAMVSSAGRLVPRAGNAGHLLFATLTIPPGAYWWSVQAIDGAYRGGTFSAETGGVHVVLTEVATSLIDASGGQLEWADWDGDQDLDLWLAGDATVSYLYRNQGGTFAPPAPSFALEGVSGGFGDYDQDGDVDLVTTGSRNGVFAAHLLRNDGAGNFMNTPSSLPGLEYGSLGWADFDQDGDLDLLMTGASSSANDPYTRIQRNDAGTFVEVVPGMIAVRGSAVAVGDFDGDGDPDVALAGRDAASQFVTRIYRNLGGVFVDIGAGLPGTGAGRLAWGDYDADGDLDLAMCGSTDGPGNATRIYRNDGGAFTNIGASLVSLSVGAVVAWGDLDNDGDLDLVVIGLQPGTLASFAKVYRNDGGQFVDVGAPIVPLYVAAGSLGDYDGDGDLDLVTMGRNGQTSGSETHLYRNDGAPLNLPPGAPEHLVATPSGDTVTFEWDPASDDHTPSAGLSYSLRIGTTPGGCQVSSPMSDAATGYRRVARLGNQGPVTRWTLDRTALAGQTLYWSVQAVDGAWLGGPFAPEQVVDATLDVGDGLAPTRIEFLAAGPNPFRGTVGLRFGLPAPAHVRAVVFDLAGRRVRTLEDAQRPAGWQRLTWDGADDTGRAAPPGLYLVRASVADVRHAWRVVRIP